MKSSVQFFASAWLIFTGFIFVSCEQTINPTLQSAAPVLVVDAWVNNKPEKQAIVLTQTQPYFDEALPTGVSGATVTVEDLDDGTMYLFLESSTVPGSYEWVPSSGSFGVIGHRYQLTINSNGETFMASSHLGRVPAIDSITFSRDELSVNSKIRYHGEFWAKDPLGAGDAYWIRTVKDDTLLNKPSEINIAYDAGFSAGGDADGVEFLPPIRRRITPNNSNSGSSNSPFIQGDSVYVEINSITVAAFNFLSEVMIQTDRPGGFAELFARPMANVSTNVTNTNASGSAVVGFFNTAAVSGAGKRFK